MGFYPNVVVKGDTVINDGIYNNATIVSMASVPITLTFGSAISADFSCLVVQGTSSVVTVAAGPGATMSSVHGYTGTSGQTSVIGVLAVSDGNLVIVGDGA